MERRIGERETAAFEVMQTGTSVSHPPPRPSRPTPTAHGNQPLIARRRVHIDPPRGDSLFAKSGAILRNPAAQQKASPTNKERHHSWLLNFSCV
jgi:hypothetical protein